MHVGSTLMGPPVITEHDIETVRATIPRGFAEDWVEAGCSISHIQSSRAARRRLT